MNSPLAERRRPIRSYVRREGRLTAAQRKALDTLSQKYVVTATPPLDLDKVFGRWAPKLLEIGCGAGENMLAMAARHPENDYLGIEVYRPGIGRLLRKIDQANMTNVRIICDDASAVLERMLRPRVVDCIFIFFPDPWPKKRHHKRRLLQGDFIQLLRQKLKTHGRLFIATDWEDYAEQVLGEIDRLGGFINLAGDARYAPRPKWRVLTRYEARALKLGHVVRDLAFAVD